MPLMCAPAMADNWAFEYQAQGTEKKTGFKPNGDPVTVEIPWEQDDAVQGLPGEFFGTSSGYALPGKTILFGLSGWVGAKVRWMSPGISPPQYVSFLAFPKLGADWDATLVSEQNTGLVLNGHVGELVPSQTTFQGHQWKTYAGLSPYLITLDTSSMTSENGYLTAELPHRNMEASMAFNNTSSQRTSPSIGMSYYVVPDTRTVRLTRNGKDVFTNEGGIWVTAGDSRYSYLQRSLETGTDNLVDIPQVVTQTINASISGWSAQNPTYSWSSSRAGDTKTQHTVEMSQGNSVWNPDGVDYTDRPLSEMLPWNWDWQNYTAENGAVPGGWYDRSHSGNGQVEVNYTITDTDGVVAEAKYVLTLHDEWEHPEPDNSFYWEEAGNNNQHPGESIEAWFNQSIGGVSAPDGDAKWTISGSANLNVALKAETSANFGLADWLKFSGSSTMNAKLNFDTTIEYTMTPRKCGIVPKNADGTDDTSVSYQPVIRYKIKSKRILLDHYTDEGRDINPLRNIPALGLTDGKWPQKGESEVIQPEAWWIVVYGGQGPQQRSGAPLPTPAPNSSPTPTVSPSPTSAPLKSGSSGQQALVQPSGSSS